MIITPYQFVRMLLANGILFENEDIPSSQKIDIAKRISQRANTILETLPKELHLFRDKRASIIGSAIVFIARKEELSKVEGFNSN